MDDLISRQAAIKAIHEEFDECLVWDESGQQTADEVESILTSLPSADAQPIRHGKWVHCDDGSLSWRCSVCGKHAYGNYTEIFSGEYHFCPNCGARMDGEQDED